MYYYSTLQLATVLQSIVSDVLCTVLQVAATVLMYYMQCYKKLNSNIAMHSTIEVQKGRALYKGPGL